MSIYAKNAEFIAHARADVPKLVHMVEILVDALETELFYAAEDMAKVKMKRESTIMGRALMDCEKVANDVG